MARIHLKVDRRAQIVQIARHNDDAGVRERLEVLHEQMAEVDEAGN